MTKNKIIIDCDPGCDDAIALIAFLTSPLFDVVGITSIGGNVDPVKTQNNALGIAALVGRTDVPVFSGAHKPLQKKAVLADDIHGESGVAGLVLPMDVAAPPRKDMDAADFIISETKKQPGDITLVVIGPMTNIAIALQRDATLPSRVKEIITMGGAFGDPGGNMSPYAEFNIFCDPHAAALVYDAFDKITVYPLDATHKALQGQKLRDQIATISPRGANVANMLYEYGRTYPGMVDKQSPLHDFHTFAGLVDPSLHSYAYGRVSVVVDGTEEGRTVLALNDVGPMRVALGLDIERFFKILMSAMEKGLA
jgi:purine nucleosidase